MLDQRHGRPIGGAPLRELLLTFQSQAFPALPPGGPIIAFVCAAAVAFAAYGFTTERVWAGLLFGALALLFNPVVPMHLARKTWQPIDAAAAVAFVAGAVLLKTVSDRRQPGLPAENSSGPAA